MPKLPIVSGKEAITAFTKLGWQISRQRCSHVILTKDGSINTLSVPLHQTLGPGLLRDLIRVADITVDEFTQVL
ncbi:type II toxin-antitoxin system HicA family toxin [Methanospirillum hungatei]|uniref:type II toxin-antitoxin system HicA family toxin n=1 Tax=Methanospirillum hungatei TaxID=2203 RepID=UPI0026ED1C0F|nr:type II toxin-antitoxin system HicA family toxin [Methanospirillum hungatei]MCA1917158.1 type II toxin-antitoxin system HicA family toxin [Methanospirillum hungatei]